MPPLKAQGRNEGRNERQNERQLDEATDMPAGEADSLVILVEDSLNSEEREQLRRDLEASIEEIAQGCTEDFTKVLAELRQRS
ncbi:MAG TPA: hypothetical protein VH165_06980 [Kofleriaceae bacterium]|nr:hypothetical protein [Kofleriaceae bacterium]